MAPTQVDPDSISTWLSTPPQVKSSMSINAVKKFLPNNNFLLSKQSYANGPVKCLFTARRCVLSRFMLEEEAHGILPMCVQYVCETFLLQFTEKEGGGPLKRQHF